MKIEIIDKNKNLKFEKVYSCNGSYRKSYCTTNLSIVDEELTKLVNPDKLSNEMLYKKNNITSDIFDIIIDNINHGKHTMSNSKIMRVKSYQ
jgi:hypothetical protein